ncbi:MAG: radical SAM protein [Haemophilus parainfluenzae]|nr:radical SAM protein [Haemophilus parainfluenzae]
MSVLGRIHSFESCGTVDGPGIRFILFMQGCLMRCKYCHNRDTWDLDGGREISVEELMKEVVSYRHFMNATGGGVTASGGEAILQAEFVRDWFRACKAEGINTCLDTNGFVRHYDHIIDELIDVTDLVLLDLKELNDQVHQNLIGVPVPGYTDNDHDVHLLGQFIEGMTNIEKVELLPYHRLGAHKWKTLGFEYELADVLPPTKESLEHIKTILEGYGHTVKY